MKALRFEAYGSPSVLRFREIEEPHVQAGHAVIQVEATGVTRIDVAAISGRMQAGLPRTPGREFAGKVIAGAGWEGKEVWGSGAGFGVNRDGAAAQYLAIPLDWLSEKPHNLTMPQAAAIGIPYLAGFASLVRAAKVSAGERVLITGANGLVGKAATQIAHWKGARVIGADITDAGASPDWFIDLRHEDLYQAVQQLTEGQGVDVVLDAVGSELFQPCLKCLRRGGRQIAIASGPKPTVELNLGDFLHNSSHLLGVSTIDMSGPEIASMLDELRPGFDAGNLKAPEITISPFANAVEVYTAFANKTARGQQVLTIP